MKRWALLLLAALATAGLGALGIWQLERRVWKLALLDRVEQRIHAEPIAAPDPAQWPGLTRENSEYLRVTATGHFLEGTETLVRATTTLGGGFWVMAPLQTDSGFIVLVNRGFVPPERRDSLSKPDATAGHRPLTVTGLVRMTEPTGGFLRANAPGEDRWYSRDVEAISTARNLPGAAPYFIDAETSVDDAGSRESGRWPVGGLTVVAFRNSHLSYAFTWFTLAVMSAAFGLRMARQR